MAADCMWTRRSRNWSWSHRRHPPCRDRRRTHVRWSTAKLIVLLSRRPLCFMSCIPSSRSMPSSSVSRSLACGAAGL